MRMIGRSLMTAGIYRVMRKMGTPAVIAGAIVGAILYSLH